MALSVWSNVAEMKAWDNKASLFDEYDFVTWWMLEEVKNFDYTWAEQSYSVKQTWKYKLQVWWAEWWYARGSASYKGWRWWYAEWIIQLAVWETLYAYVWWRWANWTTSLTGAAFNGWWKWWYSAYSGSDWRNWWGWGGTDLRIWWNTLYHRVIVAWWGWGGTPNKSQSNAHWGWNEWWYDYSWKQWTQTWGNAFWVWGSSSSNGEWNRYSVPGWWGWWYWAKAQTWSSSSDSWSDSNFYTAWWSWFVWTGQSTVPSWYLVQSKYILDLVKNIAWSQSHESVDWWTETGHLWNWYARISAMWLKKVTPTYITSAWAYHNPDLWLISISTDWENWTTISDKNVWASSSDVTADTSYWNVFQYWNTHWFPWDWDSTVFETSAAIPDLTGYEWWNLYSNDKYRTNIDWNAANKKLWKPVAFANLLSLQKGPCDRWFHIPSAEEWTAVLNAILELEWEEAEFSYDLIARYLLMAHPNARKGDWDFYSSNTSIYFTNSYIENQNKINAFVMIWDEWSESGWLSATDMNCGGYIRWFRDVAMIPTTEWAKIGGWSTVRLPLEYQEVEYIELTWTQCVNTWLYPSNDIQIETKVEVNSTETEAVIIFWSVLTSSWDGSSLWSWYHLTAHNLKFYYWLNNWEWNAWTYSNVVWTQYKIVFNNENKQILINDSSIATIWTTQWYSGTTLNIGRRWTSSAYRYWRYKYFYFKMYDKRTNEYIRDLVPCYRRIDKVAGMYDLVTNTFYTNAWTWSFVLWWDVNTPSLPWQYEEVTYLESSATQYIDTWYKPTVNTEIWTRLAWGWTQEYWAVFYWVTWADTAPDWILWRLFYASDRWAVTTYNRWFCNSDYAECQQTTANANVFHDIYSKKNYSKLDSATPTITTTGTPYQWNIYMFCWNNWWSAWRFARCKIASFLIAESWTLVRYMIPCKRKSDWEPWFYDLINGVFYTNQWTWVFSCWPSIRYRCTDKTLLYMPVSWDDTSSVVRDNSKGMNNWTWYWTAWYNTLASWKKVLSFSWSQWLYLWNKLISSQPYTIAMWVKKWWNQTNNATIVSNQYDSWHHWQVIAFNDSNKVYTFYWDGTTWVDTSALVTLENNIWYQYTVTVNWKVIKKYVNNVLVQTVTNSNPPVFTSSTAFSIWFLRTNWSDTNYRFFVWNIADLIVETWEWSADKRTDFFEATKADYWVS